MTIRYLVDTDWVIPYLNGHSDFVRRLDELQSQGLGLSVISLAELYEGIYFSTDSEGNEQDLNDVLRGMNIIGIDEEASANSSAENAVDFEKQDSSSATLT